MFFRLSCYSSVPITILAFILLLMSFCFFFFFFQAEDGIRDTSVTGVQTCALPICGGGCPGAGAPLPRRACDRGYGERSAADGRDRRGQRRERQALAPPRRPRACAGGSARDRPAHVAIPRGEPLARGRRARRGAGAARASRGRSGRAAMRALVTGATGFVGSAVARALAAGGG